MLYFQATGTHFMIGSLAKAWGEFIRYLEVGDDQLAIREVEKYKNGNIVIYDRIHWCDDFGMLIGYRFSLKPKWSAHFRNVRILSAVEFENVWRMAQSAPEWENQVASSRVAKWGEWCD